MRLIQRAIGTLWPGVGLVIAAICAACTPRNPYRPPPPAPRLYVANSGDNGITVYPLGRFGDVAPITTNPDLDKPNGVAADEAGNIYVANSANDSITIYAAGVSGAPDPGAIIKGVHTGLQFPIGVALDAKDNIYVANQGNSAHGMTGSVTVYRRGSNGDAAPYATIAGPRTELRQPAGLALDRVGNIYVVNWGDQGQGSVTVYAAGSSGNIAPIRKIGGDRGGRTRGFDAGVGFDPEGRFGAFMTNSSSGNSGLYAPTGIAVAATGCIYVASNYGAIQVFAPGAAGQVATVAAFDVTSCSLSKPPAGVAVDAAGDIFTVGGGHDDSTITVYSPVSLGRVHNGCPLSAAVFDEGSSELAAPTGLALDSSGRIYVTNSDPDGVAVFPPLHPPPANRSLIGRVVATKISTAIPERAFQDLRGCQQPAAINDYPNPLQVITADPYAEMIRPQAVAFDRQGIIYVANAGSIGRDPDSIAAYPTGSNTNAIPIAAIAGTGNYRSDLTGLRAPIGIALDDKNQIYAANPYGGIFNSGEAYSTGSITVYAQCASGNVAPIREISGAKTGLSNLASFARDSRGYLYALNQTAGAVGCDTTCGGVTIYAPDTYGDAAPVRTIMGPHARFDSPNALALDRAGNIYVANQGSSDGAGGADAITIYAASANGDVAPIARIAGPHTQLKNPGGIMVDAAGNIYVANDGAMDRNGVDTITVYPPGANGDAAPAILLDGKIIRDAIISGPATELDQPAGMAIGPGS